MPELARSGLLDGLEIHHPRNEPEDLEGFIRLAETNDLLQTGGSDFHGPGITDASELGVVYVPRSSAQELAAHAQRKRGLRLTLSS